MSWADLQGSGVHYAANPAESARFGLSVARLTVGWDVRPDGPVAIEPVVQQVTQVLRMAAADVVVVRYPAQALELAAGILRSGRQVLPAGSLTYWSARAGDVQSPGPVEGLEVMPLSAILDEKERVDVVDAVVADSFGGYGTHYLANPLLEPARALAGYQEWARRTAISRPDDALLLTLSGQVVGLATMAVGERPEPHVEVLLAGLVRRAQGRGYYAAIMSAVAATATARGRQTVIISTQSHNVRVQRAWSRQGLCPFAAVETVHAVRWGLITS